jgi:non-homologous end joining protein Ku
MADEVWSGFLRLSLIFCQIRLRPAAKLSEHHLGIGGSESENIVDIDRFVPRDRIDKTYIDTAYYMHPDGDLASDALLAVRVGMLRSERVALGHVRIGNRELPVLIEPYEAGLLLSTLHPDDERYPSEFVERAEGSVAPDMIEIAGDVINRRADDSEGKPSVSRRERTPLVARLPSTRRRP